MAVLLAYVPMAVGLSQGLWVCEHHEISSEWFTETVLDLYPFHIRSAMGAAKHRDAPTRSWPCRSWLVRVLRSAPAAPSARTLR
jgi:hypothetical protein